MTSALRVGDRAPDFTLRDQHGVDISLAATQEHAELVVVVFFPFAFSGICTGELREIRDSLEDFQHDGIQVLAISCDPMYALRAWADADGYFFPLLSDFWPHGAVSKDYGVFIDEGGFAGRATFLIDGEGIIRWTEVNPPGLGRDFTTYRAALAELRAQRHE
ncbi:MAG: peroxiredoxin [Dermatophilaceae bacterium]|nr:peroxiredoxin [Actinomycetales bacterium]MBP8879858.1 peroxiredoxin [Dermatophilaceae bacterium]MBP9917153.1 peroxiredoxin [Dermatophilaceae bacterium]